MVGDLIRKLGMIFGYSLYKLVLLCLNMLPSLKNKRFSLSRDVHVGSSLVMKMMNVAELSWFVLKESAIIGMIDVMIWDNNYAEIIKFFDTYFSNLV